MAVYETEQEWIEFAQGKTLRQLEQVLAHRRSGDTPASPPDLSARRHTLRFDVAAETLALFREAWSELRRRAGASLDDDSALIELARCVLGGAERCRSGELSGRAQRVSRLRQRPATGGRWPRAGRP